MFVVCNVRLQNLLCLFAESLKFHMVYILAVVLDNIRFHQHAGFKSHGYFFHCKGKYHDAFLGNDADKAFL